MIHIIERPCDWGKPQTFDEAMKEGQSLESGLAGSKKMRSDWDRPMRVHKPTREGTHEDN